MNAQDSAPPVIDDTAHERFVIETEGLTAQLVYEIDGRRLLLLHTQVPEELGGRGLGGRDLQAGDHRGRDRHCGGRNCPPGPPGHLDCHVFSSRLEDYSALTPL